MRISTVLLAISAVVFVAFFAGRARALRMGSRGAGVLHSLPAYHGYYVALWGGLPALIVVAGWLALGDAFILSLVIDGLPPTLANQPEAQVNLLTNDIRNLAAGNIVAGQPSAEVVVAAEQLNGLEALWSRLVGLAAIGLAVVGCTVGWSRLNPERRARNRVESVVMLCLFLASTIAVLTTLGIVLSVLFEAIRFFQTVPLGEFLFGLEWSPQTAIREDQVGSSGSFGAIPLFAGTLMISAIAMLVAVPVGLMVAIYLSEYAPTKVRAFVKPLLEVLAGIPTVVYGYFAALTVAPLLKDFGMGFGLEVSSESALGAGLVMGIMILPFVSSLSDDVINAVPQSLRDGSLGLGATRSETVKRVILPAALPGIVGGFLLAVSRAIGETMIVVMAAGLAANLTANPLEAVTTVTVQIVTLLVGDQEFDSAKTLAAFGLGLTLFVVTLVLNVIALQVVRRYREEYE